MNYDEKRFGEDSLCFETIVNLFTWHQSKPLYLGFPHDFCEGNYIDLKPGSFQPLFVIRSVSADMIRLTESMASVPEPQQPDSLSFRQPQPVPVAAWAYRPLTI